jgi:Flp pilus assembly pilin Flp
MHKILTTWLRIRLWRDERGQDLVEYALLAGLAAVASGLFVPEMSASMTSIYSRLASKLVQAAS